MRATAKLCENFIRHLTRKMMVLSLLVATLGITSQAAEKDDAERSARLLTQRLEKERFEFRAEAWLRDLPPKMGKAVRMQLFKGNNYRFCIAVPRGSGVHIAAEVLDLEGKPTGEIEPVLEGWGCILSFKPGKTGVYVIAVHQTEEGKNRPVACAMITGYR